YAVVALRTGGAQREAAPPSAFVSDASAETTSGLPSAGEPGAQVPAVVRRTEPPAAAGAPALVVDGLTKRFGGRVAVDAVSFGVAAGELFGFLGPNSDIQLLPV